MMRHTIFAIALVVAALAIVGWPASADERGLLWRVIQTCLANHSLTGGSFPCLDVETTGGPLTGYAVLRAPLEKTHIIVTPTVRTIGIEAERLRAPDAPNYFHDAWRARHFVTDALMRAPGRSGLGMAVNSRLGRSQDQLHIHVNCLKPEVGRALALRKPGSAAWTRVGLPHAPSYWALDVEGDDLGGLNVFTLVAAGLKVKPDDMDDVTIVVAGVESIRGKPGFTILARQRQAGTFDEAHGEALLDHSCRPYQ